MGPGLEVLLLPDVQAPTRPWQQSTGCLQVPVYTADTIPGSAPVNQKSSP